MNKKTLETIRQGLEERKAKLEKELAQFTKGNNDDSDTIIADIGGADDENAAEVAEYSDNLSLEESLQSTLKDITKALQRMEEGSYGICKYCNEQINEKRLLARPSSSSCIECKNKLIKTS